MISHSDLPLEREPTNKELLRALAYATNDDNLLVQMENNELEVTVSNIRKTLQRHIKGSKRNAMILSAFISATGNIPITGASALINSMTNLSGYEKNFIAGAPSIVGAALMLVLGSQLEKNSGRNYIIGFRLLSLLSTLTFAGITATTEPTEINYPLAMLLNAVAGASIPSFMLSNNLIGWTPTREVGATLARYAALAGIAPSLVLVILELVKTNLSLPATFGLTAGVSFIGTLATYFGVKETPYLQLVTMGVDPKYAKPLAKIYGQEKFPLPNVDGYLKTLGRNARTMDALGLSAAMFGPFGAYLLTTTSLYFTLTQILNMTTETAVYVTAAFSFAAMLLRFIIGTPMDKFDKSQGFITFLLGMACIATSATMQALNRPSPSTAFIMGSQALQALGIGASAAGSFKLLIKWAQSNRFPIGVMSAFTAANGQMSGFVLNAISAGIVSRDESDKYFNTFWLIAALAVTSTLLVSLGERNNKVPLARSFSNAWCGCFSRQAPVNIPMVALPPLPIPTVARFTQ